MFLPRLKLGNLHISTSCCISTILKWVKFFRYQKVRPDDALDGSVFFKYQVVALYEVSKLLLSLRGYVGIIWYAATTCRIGQFYLGNSDTLQQRLKQVHLIEVPAKTS